MSTRINVTINGFVESVDSSATLSQLIDRFNERDVHLIVEHNGRFIYPQDYETVSVSAGDMIEFINPNIGG